MCSFNCKCFALVHRKHYDTRDDSFSFSLAHKKLVKRKEADISKTFQNLNQVSLNLSPVRPVTATFPCQINLNRIATISGLICENYISWPITLFQQRRSKMGCNESGDFGRLWVVSHLLWINQSKSSMRHSSGWCICMCSVSSRHHKTPNTTAQRRTNPFSLSRLYKCWEKGWEQISFRQPIEETQVCVFCHDCVPEQIF